MNSLSQKVADKGRDVARCQAGQRNFKKAGTVRADVCHIMFDKFATKSLQRAAAVKQMYPGPLMMMSSNSVFVLDNRCCGVGGGGAGDSRQPDAAAAGQVGGGARGGGSSGEGPPALCRPRTP